MNRLLQLAMIAGTAWLLGAGSAYLWLGEFDQALACFCSVLVTLTFPWHRRSKEDAQ